MISDGNWQLVAEGVSPPGYYGWELNFLIENAADYALISLKIPSRPDWVNIGWFRQITLGTSPYVLTRRKLYQEGRLIRLEPIDLSQFSFKALSYISDYQFNIQVRYL
ncbi:hypothetical protein [Gloeothece verrucosa]|uniref:Uncharacterized protein n=1 Tax=Gloeothece verrucosa (strain PCC 7822) TaxID=497965 RepID=E0U7U1_GLOV7|nr:hypothetical protein [Gloeothece verrucosa]ADN14581.1 hypothetical protein Cyan7822_2610 [Gloeothece verrucosa PCC 7822]ADN14903.1 hypothetical protein Cyan7822_2946 [Gloeothece verrucosa PCC 7822]ADN15218.1 hypothetical protein Cyan7822_3268 [Gloeothece verrucosa PCC 7822]ADN16433.1 hypothetical protein Cyan7822_4523 [Gloeothece verrucosa PCC 7822]